MPSIATPCTTAHTYLAIVTVSSSRTIAVALQRGERVDERLESALSLVNQVTIDCFRVVCFCCKRTAEHDAIVRRVGHGEADVGHPHRLERRAVAAVLPCRDEPLPQRAKPFRRHRGEERALVGEVPIQGRARHAQPRAYFTQGQPFDTIFADGGRAPRRGARAAGCRGGRAGRVCAPEVSLGPCTSS